ncbi:MAG: glycosyltransferase [Cyanobacteria bacterium P01_C01_bin.73]
MTLPQLSIIIPTHNRPELLPLAVQSALSQTIQNLEVIVVNDGSEQFPDLPADPRLRVIHLQSSQGGAGARNVGTKAAQGRWVTYLDDDDTLLPYMAEKSLGAIANASGPYPVAVISGIEVVTPEGKVSRQRIPPERCPKGGNFFLEPQQPGRSYLTKQTLVVEREVILGIGGWDQSFRSRVHSELFLRLNPACTIVGIPDMTYRLRRHIGPRVSSNSGLRQESFQRLVQKHGRAFKAHPQAFAQFLLRHAKVSWELSQHWAAIEAVTWAITLSPADISKRLISRFVRQSIRRLRHLRFMTRSKNAASL